MVPANPPLPTTCSLPFQPLVGIQTSALMSERDAGFSVIATRQNSPSFANTFVPPAAPPRPAGGVNPPAAMVCAKVTVALFTGSDARLSHVAADAAVGRNTADTIATTRAATCVFMRESYYFPVAALHFEVSVWYA